MVKGISRQVIVVQSPETKLFEQAIFILKDGAPAVTDDQLLKEADRLVSAATPYRQGRALGLFCALGGAFVTGLLWLVTVIV